MSKFDSNTDSTKNSSFASDVRFGFALTVLGAWEIMDSIVKEIKELSNAVKNSVLSVEKQMESKVSKLGMFKQNSTEHFNNQSDLQLEEPAQVLQAGK